MDKQEPPDLSLPALRPVEFPASPRVWGYWTVWPPCVLTFAITAFIMLASVFFDVSAAADGSTAGVGTVQADVGGQVGASVVACGLLGAAAFFPRARPALTLVAWVMLPLEIALLLVTRHATGAG